MTEEFPSNNCYSTILKEIKQFSEQNEELSKCVALQGLTSKDRAQIYETFETTYYSTLEYEKQSTFHDNGNRVVLIIKKRTDEKQMKKKSVVIDDTVVRNFRKYTRLPLPLSKHQFIDYYLDCLDPYTGCRTMFSEFIQDIERHETVSRLNSRIEQVLNQIISYLSDHPSVQIFKNNLFEEEMKFLKSSLYKTNGELYKKENADKLFISVDISKADYNILKHYHEDVFNPYPTWEEFAHSFCVEKPISTIKQFKAIRERIFGNVKFGKKISLLAEYFVHEVLHEMNISPNNVVTIATDEIVLSYDLETFHRLFNRHHGTFFKVYAFRLVKLPKYDYFVKEYFYPTEETNDQPIEIIRREFKCIPLHFIMQCVKQYEGKPIIEVDRKFSMESCQVATFDEPIF